MRLLQTQYSTKKKPLYIVVYYCDKKASAVFCILEKTFYMARISYYIVYNMYNVQEKTNSVY